MGCMGSKQSKSGEAATQARGRVRPRTHAGGAGGQAKPTTPAAAIPVAGSHKTKTKDKSFHRFLEAETPDITTEYELGKILGRGQFGTTRIAIDKNTKQKYACKSISKRKMTHIDDIDDVKREIQVMHHLAGHENIVTLKGAFEDRHNIHLVMELCTGGELFDRIVARGHYTEKDAAEAIKTMIRVVGHCHTMGVIHRDLKPENFLLANSAQNSDLKAIDFGLSVFFKEGQKLSQVVGSAYYVAPEVLKKRYGKEADIWSIGVILYILLCGVPPFYGETENQIFDAILRGRIDFESEPWPSISPQAKDAVKKMLVQDPSCRATAKEMLNHEWIKKPSDKPLGNAVLDRIRGFAAMNKLKKEALKVIAENLPKEEIEGLKQMFISIDADRNGTITVDELRQGLKAKGTLLPEADLQRLMSDMDVDGNGVIDYEEFVAATMNLYKLENENLMKAFQKFDADGSGYITKDELVAALKDREDDLDIDQILAEVDKDNDGRIDYEEFRDMMLRN